MNLFEYKNSIVSLFILLIVGVVILSFFSNKITKKYNIKFKNYYSLLINLSIIDIIIYASAILNLLYVVYFTITLSDATSFGIYLILINLLILIIFSLNIKIIVLDLTSAVITVASLNILYKINLYLSIIQYSLGINTLKIIFIILSLAYTFLAFNFKIMITLQKRKKRLVTKDEN